MLRKEVQPWQLNRIGWFVVTAIISTVVGSASVWMAGALADTDIAGYACGYVEEMSLLTQYVP